MSDYMSSSILLKGSILQVFPKTFQHFLWCEYLKFCKFKEINVVFRTKFSDSQGMNFANSFSLQSSAPQSKNTVCAQGRSQPHSPGKEFHLPHFSSNRNKFFLFFLKLCSFSSSFWPGRPWLHHCMCIAIDCKLLPLRLEKSCRNEQIIYSFFITKGSIYYFKYV